MHELSEKTTRNIIFTSMQTPMISFRGCQWSKRLGLETYGDGGRHNFQECEELYRSMKQRAAHEHDQPMVSRWHFLEKMMQLKFLVGNPATTRALDAIEERKYCWSCIALASYIWSGFRLWLKLIRTLPPRAYFSISWWYWNSSGFGERPIRAGLWLICFVLAPLIPLSIFKIIETGPGDSIDYSKLPGLLAEWVRCMPFIRLDLSTCADSPWLAAIRFGASWLFQVFIATQATLFAFAVRNRFRR